MADEMVRIGPSSMAELFSFAKSVAASNFYGFDSPDKAFVAISAGMDLGLSHAQSARAWHIINGKPTLSADAMRAVCLASPHCDYFTVVEKTDDRCIVETKRRNEPSAQRVTWTIADAKRADVWSEKDRKGGPSMWVKYPRQMLQARATSELARQVYPDLLLGIYAPEELADVGEVVATATPTKAADPEPVVAEVVEQAGDGHHPTWARDQGRFFARLAETGVDYDDLKAWRASMAKPKPSMLTTAQRDQLLEALGNPTGKGRTSLDVWLAARAAEHAQDEAAAREPGEDG